MNIFGLAAWLLLIVTFGATQTASVCERDAASLQVELDQLRHKLTTVRGSVDSPALSVLNVAAKSKNLTTDVIENFLDNIDIDDKIIEVVFGILADSLSAVSVTRIKIGILVDSLSAVKYNPNVQTLMTKASKAFQDVYSRYVVPAVDKLSVYIDPAMNIANVIYVNVVQSMENYVLPALERAQRHATTSASLVVAELEIRLDRLVTPAFDGLARIAPRYAHELPQALLDRTLLICIILVITYYCIRIAISLLRVIYGAFHAIMYVLVCIIYMFWKVVGFTLWFATGFYCCGWCVRRRSVKVMGLNPKVATSASQDSAPTAKSIAAKSIAPITTTSAPHSISKTDGKKAAVASQKKANKKK